MAFIIPQDRNQLQLQSLETSIGKDNPVRFVDAFAEQLEMARLGFSMVESKIEGQPAFRPQTFLKLYLYGYLNGVRSGPQLENGKRRNGSHHDGVQHETGDEPNGNGKTAGQTPDLEARLPESDCIDPNPASIKAICGLQFLGAGQSRLKTSDGKRA